MDTRIRAHGLEMKTNGKYRSRLPLQQSEYQPKLSCEFDRRGLKGRVSEASVKALRTRWVRGIFDEDM